MLKNEYNNISESANNNEEVKYWVIWFSDAGIAKKISFTSLASARRHAKNMEQDGYRAVIQSA